MDTKDYIKIEALPDLLSHDLRFELDNRDNTDCDTGEQECNANFIQELPIMQDPIETDFYDIL